MKRLSVSRRQVELRRLTILTLTILAVSNHNFDNPSLIFELLSIRVIIMAAKLTFLKWYDPNRRQWKWWLWHRWGALKLGWLGWGAVHKPNWEIFGLFYPIPFCPILNFSKVVRDISIIISKIKVASAQKVDCLPRYPKIQMGVTSPISKLNTTSKFG